MTVPGNIDALLLGGQRGYQIERSLRFNSADSAYLNRTPASAGNSQKFTWSAWIKRTKLSSGNPVLFMAGNTSNDYTFCLNFNSTDNLVIRGYTGAYAITTAVYRDPSAWYHIVASVDTAQATGTDRIRLYVNNVLAASGSITQNWSYLINTAVAHAIGGQSVSWGFDYFDGYLTEIHFIDGQALTPSSFGETDTITGVWKPKKYTGTYGTNGFYLKFADNSGTTSTTLGKDSSGNGNNWTPNNFSVTAGSGNDSLIDTPTPYADGGNGRGNYCTWNPLTYTGAISNGNLDLTTFVSYSATRLGTATFEMSTGSWYWEIEKTSGSATTLWVGIANNPMATETSPVFVYGSGGTYYESGSTVATGKATYATNDIIGIAVNAATKTIQFYKNGTSQGSYTMSLAGPYFAVAFDGDSGANCTFSVNFGQRPFSYTVPAGFSALNTQNLPEPSIKKPSTYMDVLTWTGNATYPRAITGLNFSPDLIWLKSRSNAYDNVLMDAVRGTGNTKWLSSNLTDAEGTNSNNANVSSLDSAGFTIGTTGGTNILNASGVTNVAWCWDESATPGFDIVTYTGNGSARTIAHSLGVAPSMMIVKSRSVTPSGWIVYHKFANASPATGGLRLNLTDAFVTYSPYWNNTEPTSSVFTVGTESQVNGNTDQMVAYLWSEVAGFSKFGSYTGNGSTDGPFVFCNFRPRFVMVKRTDSTGGWWIRDAARSSYNVTAEYLGAHSSSAEASSTFADFTSNGFKLRTTDAGENASGGTYVFAAFAETPAKYSLAR